MSKKDWKKQLLRVKQIADQNLGRAEKTEVLNEDLQLLDKRVDSIQRACTSLQRKMRELLVSSSAAATDVEKRLKKMPEYLLSSSLIESGTILGEETLMGQTMLKCGDTQGSMARERLQLEIDLETQVLAPIASVIDVDIPSIHKTKKHLRQQILDMDAAKARHQSALKQQQQGGNVGVGKLSSVREELEEAQYKVDLTRDQLSTEMFSLLARESDFSKILYDMITVQAAYHKRALEFLECTLPQLQEQIDCNLHTPVYGQPLEDHLLRTGRDIAMVLEECCCALLASGIEEEGLFRIAGGASKVKKLKAAFDSGMVDLEEFNRDPHSIAGALKQYLRELPEPLMTYTYYEEWMQAAHLPADQRLQQLWCIVNKLPKDNFNNLRYLIKFMSKLSEKSDMNKMTPSNIAIVLGPNLIWQPGDAGPSVLTTGTQSGIVEALISNADWFFPGDVRFNCSMKGSTPPAEQRKSALLSTLPEAAAVSSEKVSKKSVGQGLSMIHSALTTPLQKEPPKEEEEDEKEEEDSTDSCAEGKLNGRAASVGDGIGDEVQVTPVTPVKRAITPPPLPAPAKSIHSDMYNTVFALHSLGDGSWSDYLTRVRGLWDGHMNKRLSSSSSLNGGAKDVEFNVSSSSQGSSPAGTLRGPPHIEVDSSSLPYAMQPQLSPAAVASAPVSMQSSPPAVNNNLSTESLDNIASVSPKPPRRTKKVAPPPPDKPALPPVAAAPTVAQAPAASVQSSAQVPAQAPAVAEVQTTFYPSLAPLNSEKPNRPAAPPPVLEPAPVSPQLPDRPASPRVERPKAPPPDRPLGPPPEKPDKPPVLSNTLPRPSKPSKPDKPAVASSLEEGSRPPVAAKPDSHQTHQRTPSGSQRADSLPRSEGAGHQRMPSSGGVKPPRPQPPPPPPPRTSSSRDEAETKESAVSTYL